MQPEDSDRIPRKAALMTEGKVGIPAETTAVTQGDLAAVPAERLRAGSSGDAIRPITKVPMM
jgi:hypothetical protein